MLYVISNHYDVYADTDKQLDNRRKNANLLRLVIAYRTHGHRNAKLDPLGIQENE
jgi:probable 2-oxoglutarate dehydrogenase E1 component DHKTD1